MKFRLGFLICILMTGLSALATTDVCEDLFSYACAPGILDDGTGTVQQTNAANLILLKDKAFSTEEKAIREKFKKALANPDNVFFRKMSLNALHYNTLKVCTLVDSASVQECDQQLSGELTKLVREDLDGDNSKVELTFPRSMDSKAQLQFVTRHNIFADISQRADENIDKRFSFAERARIAKDKVFPEIQKLMLAKIESLPIDQAEKTLMHDKILGISFAGTDCSDVGYGLANIYLPNASVDTYGLTFKMCRGFLDSNYSEFTMAQAMAHELTHLIDPCQLGSGVEGLKINYKNTSNIAKRDREYPIPGLVACLRSERSIGAKNKLAVAGGNAAKKFDHCEDDQITESVADWFANEIAMTYLQAAHPGLTPLQWKNGYSNMLRGLCPEKDEASSTKFDDHPSTERRFNRLMIVNPLVRKNLGCSSPSEKYTYCDVLNPTPGLEPKSKSTGSGSSSSKPVKVLK